MATISSDRFAFPLTSFERNRTAAEISSFIVWYSDWGISGNAKVAVGDNGDDSVDGNGDGCGVLATCETHTWREIGRGGSSLTPLPVNL